MRTQPPRPYQLRPPLNTTLPRHPTQLASPSEHGEQLLRQSARLEGAALRVLAEAQITPQELHEKDTFRAFLEHVCRDMITRFELSRHAPEDFDWHSVQLKCFGSLQSGIALKASDMDLMLVSPFSQVPLSSAESPIPRVLERVFLDLGFGARLLTRARVPILRLCEKPSLELLQGLRKQREEWEGDTNQVIAHEPQEEAAGQPGKQEAAEPNSSPLGGAASGKPGLMIASSAEPASLSQKPTEDVWLYLQRANRILHKLEGEPTSLPPQPGEDRHKRSTMLLVDAFVSGLRDESLKQRLLAHKSLSKENNSRSFTHMWPHLEGEQLVISWEHRSIKEASDTREMEGESSVQNWRELHSQIFTNYAKFERELISTWEKLRTLSSARMGLLSQRRGESAESYYLRCVAILNDLGGRDSIDSSDSPSSPREREILVALVGQFVKGIRNKLIRHHVNGYITKTKPSLAGSYKQFCAECEIKDISGSAQSGSYSAVQLETVKEYTDSVRQNGATSTITELAEAFNGLKLFSSTPKERHTTVTEFPKTGVGIQCDISFSNHLALHNTSLLRCYTLCDARVQPMMLIVKAWAKRRGINSPYHCTLSSYGYALLTLHFLMNVANPPVVPNLQLARTPAHRTSWTSDREHRLTVDGYDVRFWGNEQEIKDLSWKGLLTANNQSLGFLLRGFFWYYSRQGSSDFPSGFNWVGDVLSLRTRGGLLSKPQKGWTAARTTVIEPSGSRQVRKEVRQRYLLAIEDPFETDHNVARTVSGEGLFAIRNEFRRAWNMISSSGRDGAVAIEELFRDRNEPPVVEPTVDATGAQSDHLNTQLEGNRTAETLSVRYTQGYAAASTEKSNLVGEGSKGDTAQQESSISGGQITGVATPIVE